jgi:hypothetical protein
MCEGTETRDLSFENDENDCGLDYWEQLYAGNIAEGQIARAEPLNEPQVALDAQEILAEESVQSQPAVIVVRAGPPPATRSRAERRAVIDLATLARLRTSDIVLEAYRVAWEGKPPRALARCYGLFFTMMTDGVARAHDLRTARWMKATLDANPSFRVLVRGPHPRFPELVALFRSDRDVKLGVPGARLYQTGNRMQVSVVVRAPPPQKREQRQKQKQ